MDGHGDRFPAGWGDVVGPLPGRAAEGPDVPRGQIGGRPWVLAADPSLWPLAQGDLMVEVAAGGATVRSWLVTSADLLANNADARADYIRVEAHLWEAGSTRP